MEEGEKRDIVIITIPPFVLPLARKKEMEPHFHFPYYPPLYSKFFQIFASAVVKCFYMCNICNFFCPFKKISRKVGESNSEIAKDEKRQLRRRKKMVERKRGGGRVESGKLRSLPGRGKRKGRDNIYHQREREKVFVLSATATPELA